MRWGEVGPDDFGRRAEVFAKIEPCGSPGCQGREIRYVGKIDEHHGRPALYLDGSNWIPRYMRFDDQVVFEP